MDTTIFEHDAHAESVAQIMEMKFMIATACTAAAIP
jgi:hypothetical protein